MRLGSRLPYKRLGTASLDADDSQFCSAAVTVEDVRIGGEIGSLRICSAASELRCGETKTTKYGLELTPIMANGLATYLRFI